MFIYPSVSKVCSDEKRGFFLCVGGGGDEEASEKDGSDSSLEKHAHPEHCE